MSKEKDITYYIGIGLCLLSAVVFAMNVRVGRFHFMHVGKVNTGGVIIVLMLLAIIAMFIKMNTITRSLFALTVIVLIIDVIISLNVYLTRMPLAKLILILVPGCLGIALILKNIFKRS